MPDQRLARTRAVYQPSDEWIVWQQELLRRLAQAQTHDVTDPDGYEEPDVDDLWGV